MQNDLREQTEKAFYSDALPQFRDMDEIEEKAKATGTGLLTGTLALPSDAVTMAETANTFLADYANNPLAMLIKDNLQNFEKQYGRKAFDEGFEEITGIESKPENTDQLIGEILSPTSAFLAPTKFLDKLSDGAFTLYSTIKDTLSKSDFAKSDLVTEGADLPPDVIKKVDDINRPKVDLNTVAPNSDAVKKYIDAETKAIQSTEKFREVQKIGKDGASYDDLSFEERLKLYDETDIYRGEDGKLKTNASMREASLKEEAFETSNDFDKIQIKPFNYRLKDILNHEDLFKRYSKPMVTDKRLSGVYRDYLPSSYQSIGNIKVERIPDTQSPLKEIGKGGAFASYDPIDDIIYVPQSATKEEMLSAITHEIQHAIQYREGFQGGDNLLRHLPKNYLDEYKKAQDAIKVSQDSILIPQKRELQDWLKPSVDTIFEDAMEVFFEAEYNRTFRDIKEQARYIENYKEEYKDEFAGIMKDTFRQLAKREARTASKYGKINLNVKQGDTDEYGFEFTPGQIALIKHFTEGGGKSKGNIMYTNDLAKQERIDYGADRAPTPQTLNTTIQTRKKNFEEHIRYLAKTERRLLQLDNIYEIARNRYMNSFGEKEARYAQKRLLSPEMKPADDMFFRLRKDNKPKKPIDIVTSVNAPMRKATVKYGDLNPILQEIIYLDSPDYVKQLFLKDVDFAQQNASELLGQELRVPRLRDEGYIEGGASVSIDQLNSAKKQVYDMTQEKLKDLPNEITVYRSGKLNQDDGVSSFTLDPTYNVELNLPWQKGKDEPLLSYKVKKSDILATPDFADADGVGLGRSFDESELIIDNDAVRLIEDN